LSNSFSPNFLELSRAEESVLIARLQQTRAVLKHPGEKGKNLEGEVAGLLKTFLPSEYGISSGFIVYEESSEIRLSKQLDIIIYDAIRSGPIAKLTTCDVFPLEAVYAYVEVKSTITSTGDSAKEIAHNSIEKCIEDNLTLRRLQNRRFFTPSDSPVKADEVGKPDFMPIRGYVFAFGAEGHVASQPETLAKRISEASRKAGKTAHLHGLFVLDLAYFETIPINEKVAKDSDYQNVRYTVQHSLAAFRWQLFHSLSRFPRVPTSWAVNLERYNPARIDWKNVQDLIET